MGKQTKKPLICIFVILVLTFSFIPFAGAEEDTINPEVIAGKDVYIVGDMAHIFVLPPNIEYSIEVSGPQGFTAVSEDFPVETAGEYTVNVMIEDQEYTTTFEVVEETKEDDPALDDAHVNETAPEQENNETIPEFKPKDKKDREIKFHKKDMVEDEEDGVAIVKIKKKGFDIKIKGVSKKDIKDAWFDENILHFDTVPIKGAKIEIPLNGLPPVSSSLKLYIREDNGVEFQEALPYTKDGIDYNKVEIIDENYVYEVEHFTDYMITGNFTNLSQCLHHLHDNDKNGTCVINTAIPQTLNPTDSFNLIGDTIKINVAVDNAEIDCNGANIAGDGSGIGIFAEGDYNISYIKEQLEQGQISEVLNYIDEISFIENVVIKNCNLQGFGQAINATGVSNIEITNVDISDSDAGMVLGLYEGNIFNNDITNCHYGIAGVGINSSIDDNIVYGNTDTGIIFGGINSEVSNNDIFNNAKNGIAMVGLDSRVFGNTVYGQTANDGNGIAMFFTNNTQVYENTVYDNPKAGIVMYEGANNIFNNNTIYDNKYGLGMQGLFTEGISGSNIIEYNYIYNNSEAGIALHDGTIWGIFNLIKKHFTGSTGKIRRHNVNENVFKYNRMVNLDEGAFDIRVYGSAVSNNDIYANILYGHGVKDAVDHNNYCVLNGGLKNKGNSYLNGGTHAPGDCPNIAPMLIDLPDKTLLRSSGINNDLINLTNHTDDEDQDPANEFVYNIVDQNSSLVNCVIDQNNHIDCETVLSRTGQSNITVEVMDDGDLVGNESFVIEIVENNPPYIDSVDITISEENKTFSGQINAHDDDIIPFGDFLIYYIDYTNLTELEVNSATGELYTDNPLLWNKAGTYLLNVSVRDSSGTPYEFSREFTVANVNRVPVITDVTFQEPINETQTLWGDVDAYDEDPGDILTCVITEKTLPQLYVTPGGTLYSCDDDSCYNETAQIITRDPLPQGTAGDHNVTIECSDGNGGSDTSTQQFHVYNVWGENELPYEFDYEDWTGDSPWAGLDVATWEDKYWLNADVQALFNFDEFNNMNYTMECLQDGDYYNDESQQMVQCNWGWDHDTPYVSPIWLSNESINYLITTPESQDVVKSVYLGKDGVNLIREKLGLPLIP
ncbi:right-handed parallel beta-helix repeat-containing protein [Thermoproteota archaeon]